MTTDVFQPLTRIAIFYDGSYFVKASQYFHSSHPRKAYLAFTGFHEYVRHRVAEKEHREASFCQVVEAHFFRGRFSLNAAQQKNSLENDRRLDQLLMYAGIVTHYYPMNEGTTPPQEKGIDVWLSLEAYDLAVHKRFDVLVLFSGDQDFVPLIRKVNGIGTRVMLIGMDARWVHSDKSYALHMSKPLLDEASYPIVLNAEVDAKQEVTDPIIDGLFGR